MAKSLKEENNKSLWLFFSINIVLFITVFVFDKKTMMESSDIFGIFLKEKGLLFIFSPLIVSLTNGIFSGNMKAKIVFCRFRHSLPGHRVFTKLASKDPRIDLDKHKKKLGNIPSDPQKQNTLWYSLSKKHSDKQSVRDSHKNFLLTRDMASFSFLILLVFILMQFLLETEIMLKIYLIVFLTFQYLITSHVARVYGNRFTCNVLAEEAAI